MKKQLAAAALVGTIGLAGLTTAGMAAAQPSDGDSRIDNLVTAIADKFNLNPDEVQAVFDEQRQAMREERNAEVEQKLDQLVSDGNLTKEQAESIIAKRAELQEARDATRESGERPTREEMKAMRDELRQWASDNGIDTQYLRFVMGHGGHSERGDMRQNRS